MRLYVHNENFVDDLYAILDKYGIPHNMLEIEITETIVIEKTEKVKIHLEDLKNKGFIISIDDFGYGYSSLGILSQLHIDVIKLDRTFINNALKSREDNAILLGVINIVHSLGKCLVCEGVEEKSQISLLKSYDCNIIQGYYY